MMSFSKEGDLQKPRPLSTAEVMSESGFLKLREIVYRESGISLGDQKRIMLSTRIGKRLRATGCDSVEEYIELISKADQQQSELVKMIDVVTTNKTDFFRENNHFRFLTGTLLPQLQSRYSFTAESPLRVWSAGCSSGEEPYTLAFVLSEFFNSDFSRFRILATDLSTRILDKAIRAIYPEEALNDVPTHIRKKYMMPGNGEWEGYWRVRPEARRTVSFGRLNFIDENYGIRDRFHFIFHRNVMIYFDRETRAGIVKKLSEHLVEEGHLFIGHSETLNLISHDFVNVAHTIYRKKPGGGEHSR